MADLPNDQIGEERFGPPGYSAESLIGTVLDERILILSIIGSGGNGVVYEGLNRLLEQKLAVKVLSNNSAEPESARQRFFNEAQLLSGFDHENIVKFYSFGTLPDGRNYMVLEFLEGETLAQLISKNVALEPSFALELATQIGQALIYAHSRGAIHRDLKPANVMVCSQELGPLVKVLDFGVYKAFDSQAQKLTQTGALIGTANYMSPEQCKSEALDARSDIYSFGCMLYEMLVGQPPMQDVSELMIMSNHLNKKIESVPARDGISGELEKVILRSLSKNPNDRYSSSTEMLNALVACSGKTGGVYRHSKNKYRLLISPAFLSLLFFIPLLLFLASIVINHENENQVVKKEASVPRDDTIKRPGPIIDMKDLYSQEKWLKEKIHHPRVPISWLAQVFVNSTKSRTLSKMPSATPCGEEIENRLREQIKKEKNSIPLQKDLCLVLTINGKTGEAVREFSTLEAKCAASGSLKEYEYALRDAVANLVPVSTTSNVAMLEKLIESFIESANRRKNSLDLAISQLFYAELRLREGRRQDAEHCIDKAYAGMMKEAAVPQDLLQTTMINVLDETDRKDKSRLLKARFDEGAYALIEKIDDAKK